MPAPVVRSDQGQGPVVVLVHGVGVGPESFSALEEALPGFRVVTVERPAGAGGTALPLTVQADQVATALAAADAAGATLVGVSGGATLGLVLAVRHPWLAPRMVLHEPLVGELAPTLAARFQDAAAHAARGDAEAMDVVRAVMGDHTWAHLGPLARTRSIAAASRWRGEIAEFAGYAPTIGELQEASLVQMLITVGSTSGPERMEAARVLSRFAAAEVAVVPGAGNLAQVDAPGAFARTILSWPALQEERAR